ncbi:MULTISPECIES: oligosaccharide flippase family protein [unclassified Enterococcus]|jgi:O-antigen/teichoic acid export membrane protein|uniref:oligosaccharide flippase family protein n=1 Tax=unclassified Enterococcus TaxID=2608891 RepID=UPI003D2B45C2
MKKNFIYQTIYQLTSMIIPIITVPIITRVFGAHGVGVWNYVYSIVSYFILIAGLGLANYGTKEIAVVSDDLDKMSQKFWELELFNLFFVVGTTVLYLLITWLWLPYKLYFYLLSLALIGVAFDVSWFFLGISDFKRIAYGNVLIKIITFIFILLFIKKETDFTKYVLLQSGSMFFSQFIFVCFLRKKIKFVLPKMKQIFSHFKLAVIYFLGKISTTLFNNVNKTMLGIFSTMTMVGIYSNSLVLVLMSGGVLNSLNAVMIPYMSKLYSKKKNEKQFLAVLEQSLLFQMYLAVAMFFGIITINQSLIHWFFGPGFSLMNKVVPILALSIILQAFYNTIATQYLIPRNEMGIYNKSLLFGIAATLITSLVSIPLYGIFGASFSYILGQFVICVLRFSSLKKAGFRFNVYKLSFFIGAGLLMYVLTTAITQQIDDSFFKTMLQVLIGMVIFLAVTFNIYLKNLFTKKISRIEEQR